MFEGEGDMKQKKNLGVLCFLIVLLLSGCNLTEEKKFFDSITEDEILWEISCERLQSEETEVNTWEPYYLGTEGKITYFEEYGNHRKALGLYSFAVHEDELLFIDDSASRRMAIHEKGKQVQYLTIPENKVCYAMRYNKNDNTLYLLLLDITAVETNTVTYCKAVLQENVKLEVLEEIPYDSYMALKEEGQVFRLSDVIEIDTLWQEVVEEKVRQSNFVENGEKAMFRIDYLNQYDDVSLYACYENETNKMYLFLSQDGEIIAYTKALERSACNTQQSVFGYLDKHNGQVCATYMVITDDNKLQIRQPQLIRK